MSYFTLLYGDKVAQAPGQKVLPAEAFSALLDGQQLLEKIRSEAEQYRNETAQECEKLKEEAEAAGFQQGLDSWTDQIAHLEAETQRVEEELGARVLPIALKAAEAIVGREMTLNPETIRDIVMKNLKAVTEHRRITVYCHKDDFQNLHERRDDLKSMFERLESLVVQERDDVQKGGCIIETEAGIINAQWDTQMASLQRALSQLLEGKS